MCSGLTPTHWAFKNTLWDRDANPVPTSPLANDLATPPSGLVSGASNFYHLFFYLIKTFLIQVFLDFAKKQYSEEMTDLDKGTFNEISVHSSLSHTDHQVVHL